MGTYFGIFKMQFKGELQYRAKAISGIFTQFFWGIMYICLYTAFMKDGEYNGFTISQLASYVWLGQAFFALRFVGLGKGIANEITSGNVCYKFVRPVNIYNQWYFEYMGEKLSSTILRCVPIILITIFLPQNIGLSLPASFVSFLLFLVALVLGLIMAVTLSMFSVRLIFKTLSPKGASGIVSTICALLSGGFIPLPLMPVWLQNILNYLPFRFISDLPFRIYIGSYSIQESLMFIGISILWIIALIFLGKLLINRSLKKAIIQGG